MPYPSNPPPLQPLGLLLSMIAGLVMGLVPCEPAHADESKFVGVRKCRVCHKKELIGNQEATWRKGPHARAYATLASVESQTIAARLGVEGPASQSEACLSCHATAFGVPGDRMLFPLEIEDGVECEACHGPGSGYRKKKIMSDLDRARAKGLWDAADVEVCSVCHNERSPTFDPMRFALPGGGHTAFDLEQGMEAISHPIPEHVKGNYLKLDKERKEAEKRAKGED